MGQGWWAISHRSICIARELKMDTWAIRNNIRKLRFHHGEMTQQQLAEKVKVTRQTIVAIEKGNTPLLWNWLFALLAPLTLGWKRSSFSKRTLHENCCSR